MEVKYPLQCDDNVACLANRPAKSASALAGGDPGWDAWCSESSYDGRPDRLDSGGTPPKKPRDELA